ncbi:Uncharacterised protein [Vibrio cholerae]|nr:Uncharacterised protein [Vibrio cholerae]
MASPLHGSILKSPKRLPQIRKASHCCTNSRVLAMG